MTPSLGKRITTMGVPNDMTAANDALLRQIIDGQEEMRKGLVAVNADLSEIKPLLSERRRHADHLERRVGELEARVTALQLHDAEGNHMPAQVSDHESRIRALENIRWQLLAVGFLGSSVGGAVVWFITTLGG